MTTDFRALCAELLDEFVYHTDWSDAEELKERARAALANEPAAVAERPSDEELLATINKATANFPPSHPQAQPLNVLEYQLALELCKARAVLARWGQPPVPPAERHAAPVPAETLAARPLIEQVAAMGDCIGQQTVGQIMSLASRAASWLAENPPGQPVAIEPRGCPTPGACSCLEPAQAEPADEPAVPSALVDTHYEWELEDAAGEWQAGGSSNSQSDVEREGMRYLQTYAQDGPHKLIIRQHTTQTINEITNG